MKFIAFTHKGRTAYGAVTENGVIDLSSRYADLWPTLKHVVEDAALTRLTDLAATLSPDFATTEITYQIPIPAPEKILCVGVNFPDRNAEYKDGQENPPFMSLFPRFARSFTGYNQPVIRPPESPQLDYEG